MHKMSKESATALAGLQTRLKEAELILKTVLEEDTSREYLKALTTTYFSYLRNKEDNR